VGAVCLGVVEVGGFRGGGGRVGGARGCRGELLLGGLDGVQGF